MRFGVTPRKFGTMWYARLTLAEPPAAANASSEGTNTVTPFGSGAVTVLVRFVEFSAEAKPVMPFAARVAEKGRGIVKKLLSASSS